MREGQHEGEPPVVAASVRRQPVRFSSYIRFLHRYKVRSVIRWLKGGEYFRASRKAPGPCNSIFMWVQAPPLRCRGASIPPSLATGPQRAEAGVNGGIGKPQS